MKGFQQKPQIQEIAGSQENIQEFQAQGTPQQKNPLDAFKNNNQDQQDQPYPLFQGKEPTQDQQQKEFQNLEQSNVYNEQEQPLQKDDKKKEKKKTIREKQAGSSLTSYLLFQLNFLYFEVYFVGTIVSYIYKAVTLDYPDRALSIEIVSFLFFSVIIYIRSSAGCFGNAAEHVPSLSFTLILTVPIIPGILFQMLWQVYVLKIDYIISAFMMALIVMETVFAAFAILKIKRNSLMV